MAKKFEQDGFVSGLKLRLTSAELREHMRARAAYHATRRDEKEAYLPQLEDAAAKLKSQQPAQTVAQFNKSGLASRSYQFDGDDAVEQLKADIETHNNKSVAFAFLAEHLFTEDYCLDRNDLAALEILK